MRSISVVICAHTEQRWDDLIAALASVRAQQPAPLEVIVVVDHNPALFERLRSALDVTVVDVTVVDVTVVENRGRRGLAEARNTGVALSRGAVVVFLDDDAVAEPGWLQALVAPYSDPSVMGVDGLTIASWESARPAWWPAEFDWVVGCTFLGRQPGAVRNLLGANASFRREVFDVAGGFSTHLGRSAGTRVPLGCEETELCIRVSRERPGTVFLFDSRAVVRHRVPSSRACFSYFRLRCYAEGLSKAMVTRSVGLSQSLSTERRYAAVALRRGITRGIAEALRGDPAGLLRAGAIMAGLLTTVHGYLVGTARGIWRREPSAQATR